jgi:hypothetical protein
MYLDIGFGTLLNQEADASGLIAGKILVNHAAAGQYQRKLVVGLFVCAVIFNGVKLRFLVRKIKLFVFKEPRCSGMVLRRARPKDPVLRIDLFIANTEIIGLPTL